jgi:hypothetical protein
LRHRHTFPENAPNLGRDHQAPAGRGPNILAQGWPEHLGGPLEQRLDALFAANLNTVFSAVTLKALEVSAIPTPWLHQDTMTIALYGAYEDAPQTVGTPRPADGHSKDGRDDLK